MKNFKEENSLKNKYPNIADLWNYEKNKDLTPDNVYYSSNLLVWWKCKKGHEWQAKIRSKTVRPNSSCPYCSNKKVLVGYNDVMTTNKELIENEWNTYRNADLSPQNFTKGSSKKVWWICEKGHEWQASIKARTLVGNNCPKCAYERLLPSRRLQMKKLHAEQMKKYPQKDTIIDETNNSHSFSYIYKFFAWKEDLASAFPEIAKEWNEEKNFPVMPYMISRATRNSYWWICEKGHEWSAPVLNRTRNKTGCPICKQGRKTSFSEQAVFYYIKKVCFPSCVVKNRALILCNDGRSREADIYIENLKLAIEYDGKYWHKNKESHDEDKTKKFEAMNITVFRIKESTSNFVDIDNNIIFYNSYNSINYENLSWAIRQLAIMLKIDIPLIDVEADRNKIISQYKQLDNKKSISSLFPLISSEWNYQRNGNILPTMISAGSHEYFWWKCNLGHEWRAKIVDRTRKNTKCPYCSNKKTWIGFNDLKTTHPHIAAYWDYDVNKDLLPTMVTAGSNKTVGWMCNAGHRWQSTVRAKVLSAKKCPVCYNLLKSKSKIS